jgi:hypothetical protein
MSHGRLHSEIAPVSYSARASIILSNKHIQVLGRLTSFVSRWAPMVLVRSGAWRVFGELAVLRCCRRAARKQRRIADA